MESSRNVLSKRPVNWSERTKEIDNVVLFEKEPGARPVHLPGRGTSTANDHVI